MKRSHFFSIILTIILCLTIVTPALADVLRLPSALKVLEEEAFFGNDSIEEVVLPESITTIGAKAFANSSIERIFLPESLKSIAPDAFDGCIDVIGWGNDQTAASDYFDSKPNLRFEHTMM